MTPPEKNVVCRDGELTRIVRLDGNAQKSVTALVDRRRLIVAKAA
jgi:hypothetical protein